MKNLSCNDLRERFQFKDVKRTTLKELLKNKNIISYEQASQEDEEYYEFKDFNWYELTLKDSLIKTVFIHLIN